jgi:hypothetical protein
MKTRARRPGCEDPGVRVIILITKIRLAIQLMPALLDSLAL